MALISQDESSKKISGKMSKDIKRYQEKIRQAIKEDIEYIIANNPIVQNSDKKISVKIKSLAEYRFEYDDDEGKTVEGAVIGDDPSDELGEEIIETETTQQELMEMLLEELEMPDLNKLVDGEKLISKKYRPLGRRRTGSPARLNKRLTVKQKIGRERSAKRKLRFIESDKRFRHLREDPEAIERAVIFLIMDISGSMGEDKKFLARAFYACLIYALRQHYKNVETIFICHENTAREVSEDLFFRTGESGGTNISSGLKKALEIAGERYRDGDCDLFFWHATDGENEEKDNPILFKAIEDACLIARLVCLCEIGKGNQPNSVFRRPEINALKENFPHFRTSAIKEKLGIRNAFGEIFSLPKGVPNA